MNVRWRIESRSLVRYTKFSKSPRTRIFITGRPHIRAEIEKRLVRRVISVSVGPSKNDIIGYLRVKLDEDETPEAMDESLESDILEKIPQRMSEMYVGAMALGIPPETIRSTLTSRAITA